MQRKGKKKVRVLFNKVPGKFQLIGIVVTYRIVNVLCSF